METGTIDNLNGLLTLGLVRFHLGSGINGNVISRYSKIFG